MLNISEKTVLPNKVTFWVLGEFGGNAMKPSEITELSPNEEAPVYPGETRFHGVLSARTSWPFITSLLPRETEGNFKKKNEALYFTNTNFPLIWLNIRTYLWVVVFVVHMEKVLYVDGDRT